MGELDETFDTEPEFGAFLKISTRSVRRLVADPAFPALKIGRATRIPRAKALAYLARKSQGARRVRRLEKETA
jgi:hypothetical protein